MATFSFSEFMREGGWGMWPVMLLGLVALASATRYAIRPERLCLRFVALLWLTLLVAVVHASVTDVAAVFRLFRGSGPRARQPDRAHALRGPQGVDAPRRAGGIFLTLVPLPRRGRRLPRIPPGGGPYFLTCLAGFFGSSSGTPFFSWITRSPPSLQAPLTVLPSGLFPWILPASIVVVACAPMR